jgi:Apea-like HEPN
MKITLDINAEKHFNEKILGFLYELKPDKTQDETPIRHESSASHVFISDHLTEKDNIKIISWGYVDNLSGRQVGRYFFVGNVPIGLDQKSYAEFDRFIDDLYRKREINSLISKLFIYDCVFEWFGKKYTGALQIESDLISFLKEKAEGSIKKYKISLPVSFLSIEKPFNVGNVLFDYFKKDFCDRYINCAKLTASKQDKFDENEFKIFETRFRKKYQGVVFASITIEGEQQRCIEIAKVQVEKALTVLRFFSPSAVLPQIPSYFGIMGQTYIPKNHYFIFEDEDNIPSIQEGTDERRMHIWSISTSDFIEINKLGLGLASNLIIKKDSTEFEDLILSSMHLFGRSLISREFQDKIVYALVSIETLLLQNQTEPIQSNVGLRLAFLTESKPQKRKNVKETINEAYKLRSSYIHHGIISEDWELLKDLQHIIWTAIMNALFSVDRFKTSKEFLDHIEQVILS